MTMRFFVVALTAAALLLGGCGAASIHDADARSELQNCRRTADASACVELGNRYVDGDGVDHDIERARQLFTRACRNDRRTGCFALGILGIDEANSGVQIDRIVRELGRSCRRYNISACTVLIYLHEDNDGGAYDPDQAERIRVRLCDDGFDIYCEQDTDGDGFMDSDDICAFEPEDFDGFEDTDGCPDPDNDGDAIVDHDDECPDDAEDADGFQDLDGCPDPDNDGDGILDVDDQCPDATEDLDEFEDEDGCPEEGPILVELTCDAITISDKVHFDTDSDVIQGRSHGLLDQVAALINDTPYLRLIEVAGHTDARGGSAHNLDLSQRRSESVVRFLVDAGVSPERLSAVGYGEGSPIVPNSGERSQAQNRRVEFHIIELDTECVEPAPAD